MEFDYDVAIIGGAFSVGQSLATPALTSLASKSVGRSEQGAVLGVTQSVASLARTVGPLISSALIYSAIATYGADRRLHNMSSQSLRETFWTAAAIMFIAFLLATYFARAHSAEYAKAEVAAASSS